MSKEVTIIVSPEQASNSVVTTSIAAKKAGFKPEDISLSRVKRRSIDARGKGIKINISLELFTHDEPAPDNFVPQWRNVETAKPVVIVGSGPAGLFAALKLIELGLKPILLERGKDVSTRKRDIASINRNEQVNPDSNYCFGEGGAGTYSDGKLFTRSKKRGDYNRILQILHYHGAHESILYDSHPHIGTEKLPMVIASIRETILQYGGEFHYNCRVEDIVIENSEAKGVIDQNGNKIEGAAVILATGHSARDIYYMLQHKGVALEAKSFAMGVRVEHPQSLIDHIQYHGKGRGLSLPAASYSLVSQVAGRGVYSFCMCPGGFIVPASTSENQCVVNGMSPSLRNSVFANSGIVTEIRCEDYEYLRKEYGELAGLRFQQLFEEAAFKNGGGGQIAPAQRLSDFVADKKSKTLPEMSYHPGVESSLMSSWMPEFIYQSLRGGFADFGSRLRGFETNEAAVVGVESRTSSPVRIPRDKESFMHPQIKALYPSGEGAGYAGGILSAAMDGEVIASAIGLIKR